MGSFQSGQMGQTVNLLSFDFGGSNPSLPTNNTAEVAQLIEHQPSKLRVASLSLVFRSKISFTDCDDGHSRFFLCPLAGVMQTVCDMVSMNTAIGPAIVRC